MCRRFICWLSLTAECYVWFNSNIIWSEVEETDKNIIDNISYIAHHARYINNIWHPFQTPKFSALIWEESKCKINLNTKTHRRSFFISLGMVPCFFESWSSKYHCYLWPPWRSVPLFYPTSGLLWFKVVSLPARWSFSFILGSLHWSSIISNIQRTQKYSAVMYILGSK